MDLLPVADLENLLFMVVGTSDGGFTVEVACGSFRKRYPATMTFEDALRTAMDFKNAHGLRDDQVLVNLTDVWNSKDRSRGLDELRNTIRNTPELLKYVTRGEN